MTVAGDAQVGTPLTPWAQPQVAVDPTVYASWGRRVIASALDGSLGGAVTFLTLGPSTPFVPFLGTQLGPTTAQLGRTWVDSGWVVGVVVVGVLMQAYLGATPGKLVVGIAVVGDDQRPVGLVRTLVRSLAHVVDGFLLFGYARPLWHAQRRTFADSIMSTRVLRTRRPWPHRWLDRGTAPAAPGPLQPEAPAAPSWWPAATALSAVACTGGVLFSVGGTTTDASFGSLPVDCVMSAVDHGPLHLEGGSVTLASHISTVTHLWVSRTAESGLPPTATWSWSGTVRASSAAALRIELLRGDGTVGWSDEFPVPGGSVQNTTIALPRGTLVGLGSSWSARQTVVVDGVESPACVASLAAG